MASSVSLELEELVSADVASNNANARKRKVKNKPTPTNIFGAASANPKLNRLASNPWAFHRSRGMPYIIYSSRFSLNNFIVRLCVSSQASKTGDFI